MRGSDLRVEGRLRRYQREHGLAIAGRALELDTRTGRAQRRPRLHPILALGTCARARVMDSELAAEANHDELQRVVCRHAELRSRLDVMHPDRRLGRDLFERTQRVTRFWEPAEERTNTLSAGLL